MKPCPPPRKTTSAPCSRGWTLAGSGGGVEWLERPVFAGLDL